MSRGCRDDHFLLILGPQKREIVSAKTSPAATARQSAVVRDVSTIACVHDAINDFLRLLSLRSAIELNCHSALRYGEHSRNRFWDRRRNTKLTDQRSRRRNHEE